MSSMYLFPKQVGWLCEAKVLCILRYWGIQLILAYSWARPAILVAGKGRGGKVFYYTPSIWSMPKGYKVFVRSVSLLVRSSVRPSVRMWFHPLTLSITKFYFEVFWLIITLQPVIKKFSYLLWGYLAGFSSILHLWTPGLCPRVGLEVKI